ncbi:universal stress protein [Streptomyces sp. NA04227]|nr:universal stress protein [Streptomyces sp. NA04227]
MVTVGLDGTPESVAAARWAAREAGARGATLRLLHAWVLLAPEHQGTAADADQQRNAWSKRIVAEAAADLRARHPDLLLVEDLVAAEPESALLTAAEESALLVLGSQGLGRFASYLPGAVALRVVGRSAAPTVLVRAGAGDEGGDADGGEAGAEGAAGDAGDASAAGPGSVVLGLSLHEPSDELLDFAFGAALHGGAGLRVVHTLELSGHRYLRGDPWAEHAVPEEAVEQARRELADLVAPWRRTYPGVRVTEEIEADAPARVLIRDGYAAGPSGLLVVGRRRKHPPLRPRLGHVVQALAHHAACPVAVVPHD